jgi:hypothetical protein
MIQNEKEWINSLREISLLSGSPVKQKNGLWEIESRKETWEAIGPRLFDEHLNRIKAIAVEVLRERDPKFELEKDQRFAAGMHGKILSHSYSLRKGLSETLALLGCFPEALTSCPEGKAVYVADLAVYEILKDADWVLWASLNDLLPTLAEAAPVPFLDSVTKALSQTPCPFVSVYSQEGPGVMGQNYLTGLLWALETLAWHSDYLQRVTVLLGELAAIDPGGNWANRPSNSLTDIFLPWFPQTCAPIPKRKAAITALIKEQPAVAWKLIVSLLPNAHSSSMGCRKPSWRKFIPPERTDKVTNADYWEQVKIYAEMLVDLAIKDTTKLPELANQLSHLPEPAHSRVLEHMVSKPVLELPEELRLPLWESLTALAGKHRKFPNAQSVMPPEALAKIEETAAKLAPKSASLVHHRLFSEQDVQLFEELENYEEQQKKIGERRQAAVREILNLGKMDALLSFARSVKFPEAVGQALGTIDYESADVELLPKLLNTEDKTLSSFIGGFIWGRYWSKKWEWVDSIAIEKWSSNQKAAFFALLPFGQAAWQRAESVLGTDKIEYWSTVRVHPFGEKNEMLEAAEKLLDFDRPGAALSCLYGLVIGKTDISFLPKLAVRALIGCLNTKEKFGGYDGHAISEVIKWLQNNPETNLDDLFQVEWAYLPLLDHDYGGEPKTIEARMASDPSFFCEVIGVVFRSDKKEKDETKPTEQEQKIATNAYRLLHGWRTVPGKDSKGVFDGELFKKWLAEVIQKTKESGHYRIALSQIGQVLPYAPQDPDGLWIHHVIAEALNTKDADEMRSGFTMEFFNQRGVHGFSAGEEEKKLAAGFSAKADALEEKGYQRIATAVRELAKNYERDAERESKRNPYGE